MDIYCVIPFYTNTDICRQYRDCDNYDPTSVGGGSVLNIPIPNGVLYYAPPGINLDSTWQAEIGAQVRNNGLNGPENFELAKDLARAASHRMLYEAERFMIAEGHEAFWNTVKTTVSMTPKEEEFENFHHFPLQFISAGPYPLEGNDDGYYLRVVLKTSNDFLSGTDADIKLQAQGLSYTLDYMPVVDLADAIIAYNDFETGDETVYTVGPFESFPSSIKLKNDAPDFGDVLVALGKAIVDAFKGLLEDIKDFFLNNDDYVVRIMVESMTKLKEQ